jgi:tRNA A-37 threonylcarbamoyl transferase component Bud32
MQLVDIVREIHKRRVAYLDIAARNFVISLDKKRITFIDIDSAEIFKNSRNKKFKEAQKTDINDLERLFGW